MEIPVTAFVIRTGENVGPEIFSKLRGGSARIGWSYNDRLDLARIVEVVSQGRRGALDAEQSDAWGCHGFIDRVRCGDRLFYPNVPDYGRFCVVEVTGSYSFLPAQESIKDDLRSARPCLLLTSEPISRTDAIVTEDLRNKLGLQRRFYQLNIRDQDIKYLLGNLGRRSEPESNRTLSFLRMMEPIHQDMAQLWTRHFPRASLSRFLADILRRHGQVVELREGPSERGSDLVVELQNDFLAEPIVIGVQVGCYEGEVGAESVREKLKQLLKGWDDNLLSYGALVLSGTWTEEAKKVLAEHNHKEARKVKGIDGEGLARIVTRTTWMKDE